VVNLNYVCVMVEYRLKHLCLMSILACLAFCVDAYDGCLFRMVMMSLSPFLSCITIQVILIYS
jgi:hypothetical protein